MKQVFYIIIFLAYSSFSFADDQQQKKMKGVFKEGTIQDEMRVVFND